MATITESQWIESIQQGLLSQLAKNKEALPPGFNQQRFILNTVNMLADMMKDEKTKENLCKINMKTIPMVLAKGAYLGLDFFNGECYAIPYKGRLQFQTDYKGEIKLCKKYSKNPIRDIYAKVVREGDFFEERIEDGKQGIIFKPKPFSDAEMIGAFAVVVYRDGSMIYDTMSKTDIEGTRRNYSKAKDSPAWRNSPGEMYKKTVLRRLCKLIDLDFDNIEQIKAYDDGGDVTFKNGRAVILDERGQTAALYDSGEVSDVFAQAAAETRRREEMKEGQQQVMEPEERDGYQYQEYQEGLGDDYYPDIPSDFETPFR